MKKFIIITSIFPPTEAVRKFARNTDWQLVVVGDKKTPADWQHKNVIYLSPNDQKKVAKDFYTLLPWNSYCRKMVGYLYAMQQGAEIIADTDDDNIPYAEWGSDLNFSGTFDTIEREGFHNLYSYYTDSFIWPRGYPLDKIIGEKRASVKKKKQEIGVWQYLADGDPDVDAIYRLTNNTPVHFRKRGGVVLSKGALCPFNSQNTFFRRELFPLLYLPAFVTFRFTDILRGLVAQPVMWQSGYLLGFSDATVIQKRNPHNYLKDFESEIPCYLYSEKVIDIVSGALSKKSSLEKNIVSAYTALYKENIVEKREIDLLKIWLEQF